MRTWVKILGFVLLAAAAGAGYLVGLQQPRPPAGDGKSSPDGKAPPTGLYTDDEVAAMRDKLSLVSLPSSRDAAFLLLGIDPRRIENTAHVSGGQNGKDVQTEVLYRLSPSFGIATYSEHGPHFGPPPPNHKDVTRIVIGKTIPDPGNPEHLVALDERDPGKSEVARPRPGPNSQWTDWKYPNLTETFASMNDNEDITGGFAGQTSDDFDKVLDFYYQKCHVSKGTLQEAHAPFKPPKGEKVEYMMFRGYDSQRLGPAVQARFLNFKMPGTTVSVSIIRAQNHKQTLIFVNLW